MGEVSGRATQLAIETLERDGVDLEPLFAGPGLDRERLCDVRTDLSWEDFLGFLDRLEEVCGAQTLDRLPGRVLSRPRTTRALRAIARMAWSEQRLWRWVAERMGPAISRVPETTFEVIDERHFRMTMRVPADRIGSERFMRLLLGYLRGVPILLGDPEAALIEARISSHEGVFDIVPRPRRGGVVRRVLGAAGGMMTAFAEIERRQREAEQATEEAIAGRRSLAALSDVANAITQSTDFPHTADRIVDAVISNTDAVAATLYVLNETGDRLELAASRSPGPTAPPALIEHPTDVSRAVLGGRRVLWARSLEDVHQLDPQLGRAVRDAGLEGFAVIPLRLQETAVGTLGLGFPKLREIPPDEEQSLLTLGATAAAAVMAARHVARIEREIELRTESEARHRRSEERFRQIAENVEGIFYLVDLARQELLYISPRFEELTGYSADWLEAGGRTAYLELVVPEDRERVLEAIASLEESRGYELEYHLRSRAGRLVRILERVHVVEDETEGARAVGFAQDVTHLRDVEHQLRHAQRMEAVGRLAGELAHDFNNLLTVILTQGELLRNRFGESDEGREIAGEIIDAGERAGRLTRGLLTLARKQPIDPELVDLSELVAGLESMSRSVAGPRIELVLRSAPGPAIVEADRSQLEQVLINLVVNACDAMPEGGRLEIVVGTSPSDWRWIELSVRDTGHGMSEDHQRRIFDPFFSTKEHGNHSGLGLSIVSGIVEAAGGAIRVESAPEEGTRFEILLPRAEKRLPTAKPPIRNERPNDETILLVDDQDSVRSSTARALRSFGYRVIEASGGPEALEQLEQASAAPDLVLTDVVMPGMSGVELAQRVGQRWADLPIVFMTGFPGETLPEGAGAVPVVVKPVSGRDLSDAIRKRLDGDGPSPNEEDGSGAAR